MLASVHSQLEPWLMLPLFSNQQIQLLLSQLQVMTLLHPHTLTWPSLYQLMKQIQHFFILIQPFFALECP
jgi:hypothetical protein